MSTHIYNETDRKAQLKQLANALVELIPVACELNLDQTASYEKALVRTNELLTRGFTQKDLSELARSVPDVFYRHKDWESKMAMKQQDGSWDYPSWFKKLETKLQPALSAASELSTLGYY